MDLTIQFHAKSQQLQSSSCKIDGQINFGADLHSVPAKNGIILVCLLFLVTFLNFLVRFLSFLGLQEAETRKFELQAPAGGEQFNLPRFPASSRPRKVKNRGQKVHKSHEKQLTDQEDAFLVKW